MFLLIDKQKGITSHDVVNRLRGITGERHIGHAGTLDPNATGLLIVGVGRDSTRELGRFLKLDKEYEAEITLGEERETDDIEGKIVNNKTVIVNEISCVEIKKVLETFVGEQMQVPPLYSAIKIKGRKAYEMARKGKDVVLNPRKIIIYNIQIIKYKFPVLNIKLNVSSGTYIRALARDLGRKLGCGAHLSNLRRTRIGNYKVEDSIRSSGIDKDIISKYFFPAN